MKHPRKPKSRRPDEDRQLVAKRRREHRKALRALKESSS